MADKKPTPRKRKTPPRKVGRPSIVDDADKVAELVRLLKQGVSQEAASRSLGISRTAFFDCKRRGLAAWEEANERIPDSDTLTLKDVRVKDRKYAAFADAVEGARAEAEVSMTLLVRRAAVGGDVRAAMWWLDRAHPERWAQREKIEVTGGDGGPVEIELVFPGEEKKA